MGGLATEISCAQADEQQRATRQTRRFCERRKAAAKRSPPSDPLHQNRPRRDREITSQLLATTTLQNDGGVASLRPAI